MIDHFIKVWCIMDLELIRDLKNPGSKAKVVVCTTILAVAFQSGMHRETTHIRDIPTESQTMSLRPQTSSTTVSTTFLTSYPASV